MTRLIWLMVAHLAVQSAVAEFSDYDEYIYEDPDLVTWEDYLHRHDKCYAASIEINSRKKIFSDNKAAIKNHNDKFRSGQSSYKKLLNEYSDLMPEELEKLLGLKRPQETTPLCDGKIYNPPINVSLPPSVNWVAKNVLTEVKTQELCASSYAMAAVGSLESILAIKKGEPVRELSLQNLIDCSHKEGNMGCDGGLPSFCFEHIKKSGIDTEASYPYKDTLGKCMFNESAETIEKRCKGCEAIAEGDEYSLMAAVALEGPIPVSFSVTKDFYEYGGGVFDSVECHKARANHFMLLVGYGTDEVTRQDYWLLKNSWGPGWGESGYARTLRNKNNFCHIASISSVPLI